MSLAALVLATSLAFVVDAAEDANPAPAAPPPPPR